MTDQERLKMAREWLQDRVHVFGNNDVVDLAALLARVEREAKVEALEMVKSKCALGLDSIIVYNMIEAEIARLQAKERDAPR